MAAAVADSNMAKAIDTIAAGFDLLLTDRVEAQDPRDAIECITELEKIRRLADVACVELQASIQSRLQHRPDGHASAKVMTRHHAKLSNAEALGRQQTARMLADCPDIAAAYRAGELGVEQVRVLARVHANPRVRDKMPRRQAWFLGKARLGLAEFEQYVENWKRLADTDGPTPPGEVAHENRNVRLDQDFDLTWQLMGSFASTMGLQIHEIFEHYISAESLADWEKAKAQHGDHATIDDLPRTIQQRRADAMWQIFMDAAANPNSAVPVDFVHNIVWDAHTFEVMANRFFGDDDIDHTDDEAGDATPTLFDHDADNDDEVDTEPCTDGCGTGPDIDDDLLADTGGLDPDSMMVRSIDGIRLDPTDAFATVITGKIRRALIDQKSAVIDLGLARFFTGSARHAVQLVNTTCVWPGCCVPTSACEIDHVQQHSDDGRTNPGNGAPLCGKHNRWKQQGFTLWRDPTGTWHVTRPDGTEIPN